MTESMNLAKKDGEYSSFRDSPLSNGKFQFDLWREETGIESFNSGRWDWENLRKNVVEHGVRNSLLVAPMPTASTSQILGQNECFEPITSNIYLRRTLAGEFVRINDYLIKDLINLGVWNEEMKEYEDKIKNSGLQCEIIPSFNFNFDQADLFMDMRSTECRSQFDLEDWI